MTAEQDTAIQKLAELTIKLDRVKLAAERIEQIWARANRREFENMHSHESRALAENVRIITTELRDGLGSRANENY